MHITYKTIIKAGVTNMIKKLFAHVKIKIFGADKARFLSACVKKDIKFWKYESLGECYELSLKVSDYLKLIKLRKNYKVKIIRISKAGLPIFFKKYKQPWGLVSGVAVGVLLYIFMYSFYWVIDVPTDGAYTSQEILDAAKEVGVYVGASKAELDPKIAAYELMLELPLLQWASVNNDGCKIEIVLTYTEEAPKMQSSDDDIVANLVASKTGLIRSIAVEEGMVEVMVGEAVLQGEVLVTGVWDTNRGYEEWEMKEDPELLFASSRGIIMAETMCSFEVSIADSDTLYSSGTNYKKYSIGFFGLQIPFTFSLVPQGEYSLNIEQTDVNLLGTTLPIYLQTTTLTKLSSYEEVITQDKAEEILEILLLKKIDEEMGELGELISMEEIKYSYENGECKASVNCICLENIAISQKITIN